MFYELQNHTLLNLDKVYYIRKIIVSEENTFMLEIGLNSIDYICGIHYTNNEELEYEYNLIKRKLENLYGN